jgi:hypothetical protein
MRPTAGRPPVPSRPAGPPVSAGPGRAGRVSSWGRVTVARHLSSTSRRSTATALDSPWPSAARRVKGGRIVIRPTAFGSTAVGGQTRHDHCPALAFQCRVGSRKRQGRDGVPARATGIIRGRSRYPLPAQARLDLKRSRRVSCLPAPTEMPRRAPRKRGREPQVAAPA